MLQHHRHQKEVEEKLNCLTKMYSEKNNVKLYIGAKDFKHKQTNKLRNKKYGQTEQKTESLQCNRSIFLGGGGVGCQSERVKYRILINTINTFLFYNIPMRLQS